MKIRFVFLVLVVFAFLNSSSVAGSELGKASPESAVLGSSAEADEAVALFRARGQEGLQKLFVYFKDDIEAFVETGIESERWLKISDALDKVAMQKDAYASQLFWYTDFDEAKRAARKSHKPILSLRLLGNLNEEFSCANSRFFRALLYSNTDISKFLRENYILHWKSVRPAPKVTIDFGDGRKIVRTLTGNSIHYILDEDGRLIDALPGLYSPQGFMKYLTAGKKISDVIEPVSDARKNIALLRFRKLMYDGIFEKRKNALQIADIKLKDQFSGSTNALDVAPLAMAKMQTEFTVLRGIYDRMGEFENQIDLEQWKKLAIIYAGSTKFDDATRAFILRQNARTGLSASEFASLESKLRDLVALDTVRNDFRFHTKLYEWMNREDVSDLEKFNSRVYSEIFLTPDSDKWLGLYSADVYTALDGNGIIK
jgi:hypothetical protein